MVTSPRHLRPDDLEALDIQVAHQGGHVRYLEGASHGLPVSLYCAEIVPGGGPPKHVHPYIEIFVIADGRGEYTVDGEVYSARAGDVVVVPAGAEHVFVNIGDGPLRHTAIHMAPVRVSTIVEEAR